MLRRFSSVGLFVTPWTVARQSPLSMGCSRQECWSGLPCPPPGDLPDPGIQPSSLLSPVLMGGFFTTLATWEALTEEREPKRNRQKFPSGGRGPQWEVTCKAVEAGGSEEVI